MKKAAYNIMPSTEEILKTLGEQRKNIENAWGADQACEAEEKSVG